MGGLSERRIDVNGVGVFVREVPGDRPPVVFSHGNPTHSADWLPFLERIEGPAIAFDLPGWGRSDRPSPREFDYTFEGLARFFGRCLEALGIDRYSLVVHDWGVIALLDALTRPHGVERLVLINAVPLLPAYRWHWIARWFWRRRGAGELFNLTTTRPGLRLVSRQSNARPGPMPEPFIDMVIEGIPPGTWPQQLTLYRSGDPGALAAAGYGLGRLDCPALVVWGATDPYLPVRLGREYTRRLPNAELLELPDAGHWPWIDRPDLIARTLGFLAG
jgi:pimeloyl-ACP methyl ester carboxylesterase